MPMNRPTFLLLLLGCLYTPLLAQIQIETPAQLQGIASDPGLPSDESYVLANDLDLGGIPNFAPIGTDSDPFIGTFDGQGHVIRNLNMDYPTSDSIGLFGYIDNGAEISNLGVLDATVNGRYMVGILVGTNSFSFITNCYTSGVVTGEGSVGGLIGAAIFLFGDIGQSYSFADVSGDESIGGLVGEAALGVTRDSYARGIVAGNIEVGGLIGLNNASVDDSYSTSLVPGSGEGLIGVSFDTDFVENAYWDIDASGQAASLGGGIGLDTATMTTIPYQTGVYMGWDFDDIWTTDTLNLNNGYPYHTWQDRIFVLEYTADVGGVIDGPVLQQRIPGADGDEVTATALPGSVFAGWSDGVMDASRTDRRVGNDLVVTALFDDVEPPISSLMQPARDTVVGTEVSLAFTATDNASGVDSTTLYVLPPGGSSFVATGSSAPGTGGTLVYQVEHGSGYYGFATRAIDNAGNEEAPPVSPDFLLIVNTMENGPLSLPLTSSDGITTFPMTNDLDVLIDLSSADLPSTVTVQRIPGNTSPSGEYDADKLLDEYLVLSGEGLGIGWSATITWNFDPANAVGIAGELDTVFQFDGSTLLNVYPVIPSGNRLVIPGVTSLSEWYAGDATSQVSDWLMLME